MWLWMFSVVILLSGCAKETVSTTQAKPPANALAECPNLDDVKLGASATKDVRYIISEYYECAYRHDALIATCGKEDFE